MGKRTSYRDLIEEKAHEHAWQDFDWSSKKCSCGAIQVSQAEYDRRSEEWDEYYQEVHQTPAYQNYVKALAAFKTRDLGALADTIVVAKEIREKGEWVKKPPFPNPNLPHTKYFIGT